jgi:tRNA threonylcarbamoyladenosine biosynthesis protein TsaE
MLELCAGSLADTHAIAAVLAGLARSGDIVLLSGEMGAGKTAFAQGFGRALGVTEPITSPTFTLVHSYPLDSLTLHHADLYRLERTDEIADLALEELAEFKGIVLVEWGEALDGAYPDHLAVHLAPGETVDDADEFGLDGTRTIDITAAGSRWASRWSALAERCEGFAC